MDIHASGHAHQEDLKMMLNFMKPKFFMPIHGQYSMLFNHAGLAEEQGIPKSNIIVAENVRIFFNGEMSFVQEESKQKTEEVIIEKCSCNKVVNSCFNLLLIYLSNLSS